jgi:hypothetical protein
MHSLPLQVALTELIEAAAGHLATEVSAGAEVPFELESQRARRSPGAASLYCYRALTGEFIAARQPQLERLAGYGPAASMLERFEGLDRYLASVNAEPARGEQRVRAAILALLGEVFEEQTDFEVRPERLRKALERVERAALPSAGQTTLVATLHGLTISSSELALTSGLTIARPEILEDLPEGALVGGHEENPEHLIVALTTGEDEIARGREILKDLLRALRLFGDGRVTLGALAWARAAGGRWRPLALGAGGRPHGMLIVTAEQEDELRAFCNLVSRRAPYGNELAWALRRFELGCERESSFEALTDHLLALRVLLEPEGPASGLLPGRLAALCATPERRLELTERAIVALALERDVIIGAAKMHAGLQELARDISDHLRALLRDVICGHLDPNLVALADQLLLDAASAAAEEAAKQALAAQVVAAAAHAAAEGEARYPAPEAGTTVAPGTALQQRSAEQLLGDVGEAEEILDIFI